MLPPGVTNLTYGLKLADPEFHLLGPIDLLLGADVLGQLVTGNKKIFVPGGLVALPTSLGSVVMGPVLLDLSCFFGSFGRLWNHPQHRA